MNNSEQTENKLLQTVAWIFIATLTAFSFFATYKLDLSAPVLAIVWILWLVVSLGLFYFTAQGKQVFAFATDAKGEMDKVVWPTRQETVQTTFIVMAMVSITGFILWGVDSAMVWIIGKLTHLS